MELNRLSSVLRELRVVANNGLIYNVTPLPSYSNWFRHQWDIYAYALTHRAGTDITFNDVRNQKVFFNVVKIIKTIAEFCRYFGPVTHQLV